jgi:hypothetical protein
MEAKDIKEFVEFVEMAKELAPVASEIVDILVDLYGPVLSKVMDAVWEKKVDVNIAAWKKYTKAGLTREQAVQLILGSSGLSLQSTLEYLAKNLTASKGK